MRIALIIIVCGILLNGKIDGAEEYRAPKSYSEQELLNAAQDLPETYDHSHRCIETLESAHFLFTGQYNANHKGINTRSTAPEVLARVGNDAAIAGRALIQNLIGQRKRDEAEKNRIVEEHKKELDNLQKTIRKKNYDITALQQNERSAEQNLKRTTEELKRSYAQNDDLRSTLDVSRLRGLGVFFFVNGLWMSVILITCIRNDIKI